jgi:hypothetical protein
MHPHMATKGGARGHVPPKDINEVSVFQAVIEKPARNPHFG